jgi:hypothetical protein
LHLHVLELGDGEVEVLDGGVALVGVVVEEQLGKRQMSQGTFRAHSHRFGSLQRRFKVSSRPLGLL